MMRMISGSIPFKVDMLYNNTIVRQSVYLVPVEQEVYHVSTPFKDGNNACPNGGVLNLKEGRFYLKDYGYE